MTTQVQTQKNETSAVAQPEPQLPVYIPETDIYELEDRFVVLVDMPGVEEAQTEIQLEDDLLTISGRLSPEEPGERQLIRHGYVTGDYRRTLRVGARVDREGITAKLRNGTLRIELPKIPEAQPRKIAVRAN